MEGMEGMEGMEELEYTLGDAFHERTIRHGAPSLAKRGQDAEAERRHAAASSAPKASGRRGGGGGGGSGRHERFGMITVTIERPWCTSPRNSSRCHKIVTDFDGYAIETTPGDC